MQKEKTKSNIKTGIGYSPLTEKIYLGKQNEEKRMWVGDKIDITGDFINVLFQYIGKNEMRTIRTVSGSEENIFINISNDNESIKRVIKHLEKHLNPILCNQENTSF